MKELGRHDSKRNKKREEVKRKGVTLKQRDRSKWKTPSKWKEEREVITCISLSLSNTTFTHSLSHSNG